MTTTIHDPPGPTTSPPFDAPVASVGAGPGGPVLADWRAMGSRPVSSLTVHEAAGGRVQHFAAAPPAPQAAKPSILSPEWRARRAPEPACPPVEFPPADVSTERLAAMLAREGRSVLSREHVQPSNASVPVLVRDATPVRIMATGAVPVPSRMPARERPSVLEPRGPTPILYPRERP